MKLSPSEAWGYAATWGSYMSSGDPGACMYGFDETFTMQSEDHRQDVLEWMKGCRQNVIDRPDDFDEDELDTMDDFIEAVIAAPVEPQEEDDSDED